MPQGLPLSNTSKSGSPEPITAPRRSPLLLIVLAVAFGVALIVGINVLRVLYGVIAPPLPPLPAGMTETSHTSDAYGADIWRYTSAQDPCAVAMFYAGQGGTCQYAPLQCAEPGYAPDTGFPQAVVARCHGSVAFSIFHMQWWGQIIRDTQAPDAPTILNLEREVFWIGTGPRDVTPGDTGNG